MKLQQLYSYTRRAIDDYQMIDTGDTIAIGISGGKDSLTLLYALHGLRRFYPHKFDLVAVTVNLGYDEFNTEPLRKLCETLEIPYEVVNTDIGDIVFHKNPKERPCSLCAKLRKGALNDAARRLGCNKVAYAHHKDDIIETMMLSLIFEGRFHSFSPKTYLDKTGLTVIRPMMYLSEADVIGFKNKMDLPIVKNPCPVDGHTKRQYAKDLLRQMNLDHPGVKDRMFTAIVNGNIDGWPAKNPNSRYTDTL